jgi:4-diphosphocytidyl-2-C-methyl-D-erythritol kinase
MMGTIVVTAPAKLNLFLAILGIRQDRYHRVLTLLQSIDLCDRLEFTFQQSYDFKIELTKVGSVAAGDFPLGATNLIHQAAASFIARLTKKPKIAIQVKINKNIPIGAGLAGGSSDAAATLLALNQYFGDAFSPGDLMEIAAELGSDVPFCLVGGTGIGRGKGEQLENIDLKCDLYFIIAKPRNIAIASSWAYSVFDEEDHDRLAQTGEANLKDEREGLLSGVIAHLVNGSIEKAGQMFGNDLESPVFKYYPVLKEIRDHLLEQGCIAAHMTGSGSTIYGVLQTKDLGGDIIESLSLKQADWAERLNITVDAWLVKSVSYGARIEKN